MEGVNRWLGVAIIDDDFINEIINEIKANARTTSDANGSGDASNNNRHISYDDFLGLWDLSDDEKMRQSLIDVQQRRIKHDNSRVGLRDEASPN